jgi:diadenylate cyclase
MPDTQHFREVLSQFDWTSAVDVLLIATVIFTLLRIMTGTRVMTQLRGVLALFLIFVVVGQALDLTVINYLVEHSVTALLIGGAIIFQPELRRALDRLGRTGVSGWFGPARYEDVIESVVKAAPSVTAGSSSSSGRQASRT